MDTDTSASDLDSVQYQVIGPAPDFAGFGFKQIKIILMERCERMMNSSVTLFIVVIF